MPDGNRHRQQHAVRDPAAAGPWTGRAGILGRRDLHGFGRPLHDDDTGVGRPVRPPGTQTFHRLRPVRLCLFDPDLCCRSLGRGKRLDSAIGRNLCHGAGPHPVRRAWLGNQSIGTGLCRRPDQPRRADRGPGRTDSRFRPGCGNRSHPRGDPGRTGGRADLHGDHFGDGRLWRLRSVVPAARTVPAQTAEPADQSLCAIRLRRRSADLPVCGLWLCRLGRAVTQPVHASLFRDGLFAAGRGRGVADVVHRAGCGRGRTDRRPAGGNSGPARQSTHPDVAGCRDHHGGVRPDDRGA